jgi:hypothetical protein
MRSLQRVVITNCSETNRDFLQLYKIFTATLRPGMPFRVFKAYYASPRLKYIDVTFITVNGVLAGFCSAAFYEARVNGRNYTIGRAAIGIKAGYRGGILPTASLYSKYIRYKCRHPLQRVMLNIYVANPLVYAMICKYSYRVYPKKGIHIPADVLLLKEGIIKSNGLNGQEVKPFVLKIHFHVLLEEDVLKRIAESDNGYVRSYVEMNPFFREQYGVLVIIPVTLANICSTVLRLGYTKLVKWCKKVQQQTNMPAGRFTVNK